MQLHIFHKTWINVKYTPNTEPFVVTRAGETYVNPREILVIFDGPVRLEYTGEVFVRGGAITVDRTYGDKRWNVRLGTPVDDRYYFVDGVSESEIPETVIQAVNTFIQAFEN